MGIEARRLTENNAAELAEWCGGLVVEEHDALDHSQSSPGINVQGKNGVLRASVGNTIVRSHDGFYTVVKTASIPEN